ncbi:serine hydrolase domain-containing protein [Arcobacter cloacae]|uniref:6-aminohexanoate hydrolase n=1 Tax=Arcobacter cloacae TaxID=1054034 RepID=A0A6M8N820_9BACT|nr:serine hydrolase [Arcobacter cloacae]QKF90228.1 class C beta-lactamase-related serine hydrolase [Arcobacter cloacae]RXI41979.1 6-aminohexanoate hydrolase [Arcobacter cloacae]
MSFSMSKFFLKIVTISSFILVSIQANTQSNQFLDATQSDPNKLAWMVGFPPSVEKLIMQPESDFFSFPKLRWTVCHIRELMPTKEVSRRIGSSIPLEYEIDKNIDSIKFNPLNSQKSMSWEESLLANYTDGILILHKGKIVYEKYFGCLNETNKHAAMSMTKSLTGLLAQILVAEKVLDDTLRVDSIIPELKNSAFGSATVREVMDMTTALDYSEDYSNPNADIWIYSKASSPLPKPKDYKGPNGYFEYLQTVKQKGVHGEAFGYKTINTDTLGWIISRVTNKDLTQLLSERIWSKIGAQQDAYMTVDAKGTPFAGGGLSASLRDLGKIGLLMLNEGKFNNQQLFPKEVVEEIKKGGDKKAFAKAGYKTLEGGSYHSMWWIFHNQNKAFAARGVHGQTIYVDPTAEMVIVRFASFPTASNIQIDPTSLPAFEAVAKYLMEKEK